MEKLLLLIGIISFMGCAQPKIETANLSMGLEYGSDVETNIDTSLCVIYSEETNLISD